MGFSCTGNFEIYPMNYAIMPLKENLKLCCKNYRHISQMSFLCFLLCQFWRKLFQKNLIFLESWISPHLAFFHLNRKEKCKKEKVDWYDLLNCTHSLYINIFKILFPMEIRSAQGFSLIIFLPRHCIVSIVSSLSFHVFKRNSHKWSFYSDHVIKSVSNWSPLCGNCG